MSAAWSWYVIVLTVVNIAGLIWLLLATARKASPDGKAPTDTMGHVWDGDLQELNNPLPRWWLWLFVLTIVFGVGYLVVYPGLGNFSGTFGWTSTGEVQRTLADTHDRLETLYAGFRDRELDELARDPAAVKVGRNVYANNCAACHGSDARGADGYPNLVDADWLYGGEPETILASVEKGRHGLMPPLAATLPGSGVEEVAHYVLSLSSREHDKRLALLGKPKFEMICAACHGVEGTGNHALGAPNLADDIWLYGQGDIASIRDAIVHGRAGVMPAWGPLIGNDRARLATAWILAQAAENAEAEAASARPGGAP